MRVVQSITVLFDLGLIEGSSDLKSAQKRPEMNSKTLSPRFLRLAVVFPRLRAPVTSVSSSCPPTRSRCYSDHPKVQASALEALSTLNEAKIIPKLPTSIKRLNKQLATRQSPDLPEEELEEKFVRGESDLVCYRIRSSQLKR